MWRGQEGQSRSRVESRYLSSRRSLIHWLKLVLLRAACAGRGGGGRAGGWHGSAAAAEQQRQIRMEGLRVNSRTGQGRLLEWKRTAIRCTLRGGAKRGPA